MSKENLVFPRAESSCGDRRELPKRRRCKSQLSYSEHSRSSSQLTPLPALTPFCTHCKHPLSIDANRLETANKSRASTTRHSQRSCNECTDDDSVRNDRSPSSRLLRSTTTDWTCLGDKIETWFEKARTPDQRVVYNFLEQINNNQEKEVQRTLESPKGKNLNDVLNDLKKHRARFSPSRNPKKFNRVFESTSWRVMRQHSAAPQRFSRYDSFFGDEASRHFRIASVFTTTEPKVGSTFVLHPDWV